MKPTPEEMADQCSAMYAAIEDSARQADTNHVRPELPVRLSAPSHFEFVPAASLAIQSLVPRDSTFELSLRALIEKLREACKESESAIFWQPAGTFHLNVAILIKLAPGPVPEKSYNDALQRASHLLESLRTAEPYVVHYRGLLIAADGTILAKGFPTSLQPFRIRKAFIEAGFPIQQVMCHVTLGRILEVLHTRPWLRLQHFAKTHAEQEIGDYSVREAILVKEHEGFLHSPSCYKILQRFRWSFC